MDKSGRVSDMVLILGRLGASRRFKASALGGLGLCFAAVPLPCPRLWFSLSPTAEVGAPGSRAGA